MYYWLHRLFIGCKHEYYNQYRINDNTYHYERIIEVYQCKKCYKLKKIVIN